MRLLDLVDKEIIKVSGIHRLIYAVGFFPFFFMLTFLLPDFAQAQIQCYDCHGTRETGDYRPLDATHRNMTTGGFQGNHRTHMPSAASPGTCQKCHPGSAAYTQGHRDGRIRLEFNINSSAHPLKARYVNSTSSRYFNYTSFPQTSNKSGRFFLGSCNNVNCHFESKTPAWGSDPADSSKINCNSCHNTPPISGSHPAGSGFGKKHGEYFGNYTSGRSCSYCHSDHKNLTSFSHASSVRNRPLNVRFKGFPNTTGAYSGNVNYPAYLPSQSPHTYGNCSDLYCHSNGKPFDKEYKTATPAWAGASLDCTGCHKGGGSSSELSGRHAKHTAQGDFADAFICERCHSNTATGSETIKNRSLHVNALKNVSFMEGFGRYSSERSCKNTYCHSNALGGLPMVPVKWSDTNKSMKCSSCHRGRVSSDPLINDNKETNCLELDPPGVWSYVKNPQTGVFDVGICTPFLHMTSNGHQRLVGPQWIRKYPCTFCHAATVVSVPVNGKPPIDGGIIYGKHLNYSTNVLINDFWRIEGGQQTYQAPFYNKTTKSCDNVYCHSDGTTDPDPIKPVPWNGRESGRKVSAKCNSCHGHSVDSCSNTGCHDGRVDSVTGKVWKNYSSWTPQKEWMSAMPMFPNQGPGLPRANSHTRHVQTNFTCDICHNQTIVGGSCTSTCHGDKSGYMGEVSHLNPANHVNKKKDVSFKVENTSYNSNTKTCLGTGTGCHTYGGVDPVWGGSVNSSNSAVICLGCHRTAGPDVDDFAAFNGIRATINQQEWETTGHGRYSTSGRYPVSNNPAANFPGNPCWYCHDNKVLHNYSGNPYRLQMHHQFERRFDKECVYCHMERTPDASECIGCHVNQDKSIAPQATGSGIKYKYKFNNLSTIIKYPLHTDTVGCITGSNCHNSDSGLFPSGAHKGHNTNSGTWTTAQKNDVRNQYLMMGVCLKCHDDDSGGQCTECHTPTQENLIKYKLGFNPGTGFIQPKKARATSAHFGYKHYRAFKSSGGWDPATGKALGTWKGGKFCWDCHDPHGDSNIYMIQSKVATTTDGKFGIPKTRADVTFVDKISGSNYVRKTAPFNGICNVCHAVGGKHYTANAGDGHNYSRVCTTCHEHRFSASHANNQACNSCHTNNKPIPKHTAFGLPRDCTKCHSGTIGKRMDVMGQMKSYSHHVQGVEVTNKHCYSCHWESTKDGLIDTDYHTGYNYKNYSSVKNDYVDLVVWGPGNRPTAYREYSTAQGRASVSRFLASGIGTGSERTQVGKITNHCLSCHSDQNNDIEPFGDYRQPRQYAWDYQSVGSRYSQPGKTTTWGKYSTSATNKKKQIGKSFSAHGNAEQNQGGWSSTTGYDVARNITRGAAGTKNIQCFDCHNSHGSKVVGTTTSYVTFNGTNNGGNLKETKLNIGGYTYDYKASGNTSGINPYGAGAGQCFDCHNTAATGTELTAGNNTPWGYNTTFGATAPIMGYKDTVRFGQGIKASTARYTERNIMKTIVGGHLGASYKPYSTLPHLAKASGNATGGTATSLVDGSKSWTVDKWKNLYLLMTGGRNIGQIRKISANNATILTVEPFTLPILPGESYNIVPYTTQVNGLCTTCHDPHGISTTLGDKQSYAVPLLKGSWLTSPYKEDQPPPVATGLNVTNSPNGVPRSWGKYQNKPQPTDPTTRYSLDRFIFAGSTRISENDDKFAGLCTNCHQKNTLTDGTNINQNWKTVDRIHESVKGWGANTEHSYTCSKCHQPHNSGLPRLMQTNCLDYKHRGNRASGGLYWAADMQQPAVWYGAHGAGREHRGYPIASMNYVPEATTNITEATTSCHVGRFNPIYNPEVPPPQWPDGNLWNSVTPW